MKKFLLITFIVITCSFVQKPHDVHASEMTNLAQDNQTHTLPGCVVNIFYGSIENDPLVPNTPFAIDVDSGVTFDPTDLLNS